MGPKSDPNRGCIFIHASSRVGAMSHTAPAGRPKAAQSAARAPPLSAEPLRGALLQSIKIHSDLSQNQSKPTHIGPQFLLFILAL